MTKKTKLRTALMWLAAIRFLISVVAIPLAPFLYREHFVVLVLMRPTKEVLLAAGFLIKAGKVGLLPVVAAALPLMVLGVWLFYYLGRAFRDEITEGELPGVAGRILSPEKVKKIKKVLDKKGSRLIVLGRLAAFPSTIAATAAGAGRMTPREFLPYDAAGAAASIALAIGAGYALGQAYEEASPVLSVVGVMALAVGAILLGRYLKRA